MILQKTLNKIKKTYYTSYIYYLYTRYILTIEFFKIFIDIDYLRSKIKQSYLFNCFYKICKNILTRLPGVNLEFNYLSSIFLIIFTVIVFDLNDFYIKIVIVLFALIYILKNKDFLFFSVSSLVIILLFIIKEYGAEKVVREGFVLWCSGTAFYLTYKSLKKGKKLYFLKYIYYINIAICLIASLSEKNIFYGKIILYLLPFSLAYTVLVFKRIKKLTVFSFVILISVLVGIKEGGLILSGLAFEIIMFCVLYNLKYIFLAVIITPAAIASLINRLILIRRGFLMAGITFNNMISVLYRYINNGLKADALTVKNAITQNTFKQFESIALGEQFFVYTILVFILITVLFLGRYIFRLIRKTLFLYSNKNIKAKALISGAISFFAGTSFIALLSPFRGNINTMVVYWILLGFIRTLNK